jgi:hypothetical protein
MVKRGLIFVAVTLSLVTLSASESQLERLGRSTQWFLVFINDPYNVGEKEIEKLHPKQAAQAINTHIELPADGSEIERKLLERHSKISPAALPKSLRKFVEKEFAEWKKATGNQKLKLKISESRSATNLDTAWRQDNSVSLPVAAIGRDVVRATRDETLFKLMMWTFTHPKFADRRPSATSSSLDLTGQCFSHPVQGLVTPRCGGEKQFQEDQSTVKSAVTDLEERLRTLLRRIFESVTVPS